MLTSFFFSECRFRPHYSLKHKIDTGSAVPVHLQPRRTCTPEAQKEEVRQLLQDMLKKDIIETSESPWASPLQISKTCTTPYRPQCNGMVERFNQTLLSMLSTTVGNHPSNWEIPFCFAYNSSRHSTTGYSPFFLMFGRQANLPVDLMYPLAQSAQMSVPEFVQQMKESLWEAYATVRQNCQSEHCRQ